MRNAAASAASRYRESPVGRVHVHLGRLLAVYALLSVAFALGLFALEYVVPTGSVFNEAPLRVMAIESVAAGLIFSPVQALAVTALWSGMEGVN